MLPGHWQVGALQGLRYLAAKLRTDTAKEAAVSGPVSVLQDAAVCSEHLAESFTFPYAGQSPHH